MPSSTRLFKALGHMGRIPEVMRCRSQCAEWWPVTTAYIGLTSMSFPKNVSLSDGNQFRFQEFYDLETLWQIYFRKIYEVLPTDKTILDLGANVGLFSCYAARQARQSTIYSVEPFPTTFARLKEHVSRNSFSDRIHCHQLAVGGKAGRAVMVAVGDASQMNTVVTNKGSGGDVEVEMMTLPSLMEMIPARQIDLMKMDIEGSEHEVLSSCTKKDLARVARINVEYHPGNAKGPAREKVLGYLRPCGFELKWSAGDDSYGVLHLARC